MVGSEKSSNSPWNGLDPLRFGLIPTILSGWAAGDFLDQLYLQRLLRRRATTVMWASINHALSHLEFIGGMV